MVPKGLGLELATVRLRIVDLGVDRSALAVEGLPSAAMCSVAALHSDDDAEHSVLWCTEWLLSDVTLMSCPACRRP